MNETEPCPYCNGQLEYTTKHKNIHSPKHFHYYKCVDCKKYWCEEK